MDHEDKFYIMKFIILSLIMFANSPVSPGTIPTFIVHQGNP